MHAIDFGSKLTLIQVDCQRMAYQATYYFYLKIGTKITQQIFNQFESADGQQLDRYSAALVTGLPTFRNKDKTLFILRKYRGFGDCGQYLEYRLAAGRFVLNKLRVNECAETFPSAPTSPQNWPIRKKAVAPRP